MKKMIEQVIINGRLYSTRKLTLDWFTHSNDTFFDLYGFNFNPHKYPGLYEWGREYLYGQGKKKTR